MKKTETEISDVVEVWETKTELNKEAFEQLADMIRKNEGCPFKDWAQLMSVLTHGKCSMAFYDLLDIPLSKKESEEPINYFEFQSIVQNSIIKWQDKIMAELDQPTREKFEKKIREYDRENILDIDPTLDEM